jgi:protein-disulfide isomerase
VRQRFWRSSDVEGENHDRPRASSKLVTEPGANKPKALMVIYEDFLCPICGDFERSIGPTVSKLIDIGAIAADYAVLAILDPRPNTQHYSSRAGAAALCVADESIDAFRRFHNELFSKGIQPQESGTNFPDNAQLIEYARVVGVSGAVSNCVNSGKYIDKVNHAAAASHIDETPTILINGERYLPVDTRRSGRQDQSNRGRHAGHWHRCHCCAVTTVTLCCPPRWSTFLRRGVIRRARAACPQR